MKADARLAGATVARGGPAADGGAVGEATLAELYQEHYRPLVGFAFVLIGDMDLAEDLAQEAFVRASRRLTELRQPQAARAYLRTSVTNLARRSFRRRFLDLRARVRLVEIPGESAREDRLIVRTALRALPPRQRACVVLRYYEGMSEPDAAQVLGVSVGTVKSQTYKALRHLERALEGSR